MAEYTEIVRAFRRALTEIGDKLEQTLHAAAAAGQNGRKSIPADITPDDFNAIRTLLDAIRKQTGADIVNMRLNKTGTEGPAPVFVGWVESDTVKKLRLQRNEADPGFSRLGDTVASKEYKETLGAKGAIVERDWRAPLSDGRATLSEKSPEQKALVPRVGLMYQMLIGIIVDSRCVGTLNLGFPKKPTSYEEVKKAEEAITRWAQDKESKLVEFIKTSFALGGPGLSDHL